MATYRQRWRCISREIPPRHWEHRAAQQWFLPHTRPIRKPLRELLVHMAKDDLFGGRLEFAAFKLWEGDYICA